MDTKTFYGAKQVTSLALIPENPEDSDADLSDDDDQIDVPDYQPTPTEESEDTSFGSMDEGEAPSTSSSSRPPPQKQRRKEKNNLKTVSLVEPVDITDPCSPSGTKKALEESGSIETLRHSMFLLQDLNPLML